MLRLSLLALVLVAAPLAQAQNGRDAHREFVAALALQWEDDHQGAIGVLDALLELKPESGAVHDALAESYIALGRPEEAFLSAEAATRFAPEEPAVWTRLGELLRESDPEAAAEHFETALRLRPDDPALLATLADLYASLGRTTDAVRALSALVRVGETPAVHIRLAVLANASGDSEAELRHLRRASVLAPDEGAIAMLLATALRDANQAPEALATLDRYLSRHPSDAAARALRAELSGETPGAAADARSPADRLQRARDLYEASAEDESTLEEAETLVASVLAQEATPEALGLGGRIAYAQRRYALAADRLVRALDTNPRDAGAWPLAVRALVRSGDDRAARVTDDALLFLGSDPDVAEAAAEAALARGDAEAALGLSPPTPNGHALRAMALAALDRVAEAADALASASGADPVLTDAASGDLAAARGESAAARAAWDRALVLDPDNGWLRAR
ncbi:tetratricopeptide repeat protein [Rubricoccus marinus]|uniref:Tetratricopeptide repeat protein n=1 Tax=Rubricoccus marinus TaxID=716817 RepID=A0A259TXX4_9BACT|nr:tetratricopeptide repeat protein [Rubricoccus marinus]OZC02602.1 hypothetical protein BSZ36_06205 [Rubricoccus marinus]